MHLVRKGADLYDRILIQERRKREIIKFRDPRRVNIYQSVNLTSRQKAEIDELFYDNYGEKIPYTWHQHYTAFTGNFDPTYIPELIYIPEFEYFMNPYQEYVLALGDKNILPYLAKSAGIKTPESYCSSVRGFFRDQWNHPIDRCATIKAVEELGEAFIKPSVDSCSGNGCAIINIVNGKDLISGLSVDQLFSHMGKDFVIQERLKCHSSISALYPKSVNTFRIITYRWKNQIFHFPIIMRIGSNGGFLDNAHQGGMFIAIDEDGRLHDQAFTEFRTVFTEHPDSKIKFSGYTIPFVKNIIEAANRMHALIPQIGLINWDFTIDENDIPVLIEANTRSGSIWLPEIAHGCGAFGDKTAEILRWMRLMKKTKKSNRVPFYWGQM